ncbi:unnamed protein product [Clonostachys chloroleuca]|uniref:Uncharacterized protein n=1 Tax=Clonostachys chloroleuca TaxID=1926264 RepID=A0AA35M1N9_9HYPO|nr:unnamed protein product [Clonostachys chloroleuca]
MSLIQFTKGAQIESLSTFSGYRQLHRREEDVTNWSAEGIFHYYTQDGSLPDDTTPHVVAFIADQAPLIIGLPTTSAVQAAIWLPPALPTPTNTKRKLQEGTIATKCH